MTSNQKAKLTIGDREYECDLIHIKATKSVANPTEPVNVEGWATYRPRESNKTHEYKSRSGRTSTATANWIRDHWHWPDSWAPVAWRQIDPTPAPQWHDDASPTVELKDVVPGEWYYTEKYGVALCVAPDNDEYCAGFAVKNPDKAVPRFVMRYPHGGVKVQPLPSGSGWDWKPPYQPPTTWQKTSERPPTEADASDSQRIAAMTSAGGFAHVTVGYAAAHPELIPEWIPTASLLSACRD